jgi:glycosyltransferase involved in cell wall biosynthesis
MKVVETGSFAADPHSREGFEALTRVLGDAACRRLGFYVIPDELLLSVVIPVYNERKTLLDLVEEVRRVPIRKELIIVDDGSSDGSTDLLRKLEAEANDDPRNRIVVAYHERNRGKGAALRTGFAAVQGDIVIVQDSDLEYDPSQYVLLVRPIVEGEADVVYGSRFLGDQPHRVLYFWHYVGNKLLTTLSNCFTNLNLTDMETCYKVFRRSVIAEIGPTLQQERFGFEPEVTAKVARRGYRVYEMSISYSGRTYEQGKKIGWRDGLSAFWCIVRYGFAD